MALVVVRKRRDTPWVGARREYDGWVENDALDPEAATVLAYLDQLVDAHPELADRVVAHIDGCGVVTATLSLDRGAELYIQAGDGWDRVLWTCPSGRVHEWRWHEQATPEDLDALVAGRGAERTAWVGTRLAGVRLVADERTLATTEGRLRLAVLRRLPVRVHERDEAAL